MKVKRFENIWTMGLILLGAMLFIFYLAKVIFPEWMVGVAQTDAIVKVGNFIDENLFVYIIFEIFVSFCVSFFYCGACCQKRRMNYRSYLVILAFTVVLTFISIFMPLNFTAFNYAFFALLPFLVCLCENNISKSTFISTIICFSADIIAAELSKIIRDLTAMATKINTATLFVLLIDMFIWRILFYLFFNNKRKGDA